MYRNIINIMIFYFSVSHLSIYSSSHKHNEGILGDNLSRCSWINNRIEWAPQVSGSRHCTLRREISYILSAFDIRIKKIKQAKDEFTKVLRVHMGAIKRRDWIANCLPLLPGTGRGRKLLILFNLKTSLWHVYMCLWMHVLRCAWGGLNLWEFLFFWDWQA